MNPIIMRTEPTAAEDGTLLAWKEGAGAATADLLNGGFIITRAESVGKMVLVRFRSAEPEPRWSQVLGSDFAVPRWLTDLLPVDLTTYDSGVPCFTHPDWVDAERDECLYRVWASRPFADAESAARFALLGEYRFWIELTDPDTGEGREVFLTSDEGELRAMLTALLAGITKDGIAILDPSTDETGREIVADPFTYYAIAR